MSEPPTIRKIQEAVARRFGVSVSDILSLRRNRRITYARQMAIYVTFRLTDLTNIEIGHLFGRDQTTIGYSVRKIERGPGCQRHLAEIRGDIGDNGDIGDFARAPLPSKRSPKLRIVA